VKFCCRTYPIDCTAILAALEKAVPCYDGVRADLLQSLPGSRFVRDTSTAALPPLAPATAAGLPQADLVAAIPRLRRYARVLTGNPTRADDLVQDTLARAWDKRSLWQAGSDLRAWLFTIMHNVFVNQCALARREAGNISLDSEGEYGAAWQVAEYGNQLVRIELRELLQQMGRLPPEQREVLLLAAVEELSYHEIAAALAIPIGTVMSRLFRARDKLRRIAVEPPSALKKVLRDRKESGFAL
jgi:RNA polymerase sigma-70 factor, ECF subfamily